MVKAHTKRVAIIGLHQQGHESKTIAHLLFAFQRLVRKTIEQFKELKSRKGKGRKTGRDYVERYLLGHHAIKMIREKNSLSLNEEDGGRGRHQHYFCEKHCQREARTSLLPTTDGTFLLGPNEERPA